MKVGVFILVLLAVPILSLQSQEVLEGRVTDHQSGRSLPFVHILLNDGPEGVVSDVDGYFSLVVGRDIEKLTLSYVGYQSLIILGEDIYIGKFQNLEMLPVAIGLGEVLVHAGENPALRLIRGVYANRDTWDPEQLSSFSYLAYNKMELTAELDSIALSGAESTGDTTLLEAVEFLDKQYFFISESVSRRTYRKPGRNSEEVIATRTSGFKNPLFIVLGTELQSFSFYQPDFGLAGVSYKSPVSRNAERFYEFHIRDIHFHPEVTDTTYVVAFYPKKGTNFSALEGLLYIRVPDFAIENVLAQPAIEEGGISLFIRQQYRKVDGKQWFPVQLNSEFKLRNEEFEDFFPLIKIRTYLDSIQFDLPADQLRRAPVDVLLRADAVDQSDEFWSKYRFRPLDSRDSLTYFFMDSLGQEHDFDRIAEGLSTLLSGKIPFKMIDFKLNRILKFNRYEGLRLGLGLSTNHRFSKSLELAGWWGYGFGDKEDKFGGRVSILLNRAYQLRWELGYEKEIYESGGFDHFLRSQSLFENHFRYFFIEQLDLKRTKYTAFHFHPRANLQTRLSFNLERAFTLGEYFYQIQEGEPIEYFNYTSFGLDFAYAPKDRYYQGIRDRQRLNYSYPRFYLTYRKGFDDLFSGDFDFHRLVISAFLRQNFSARGILTAEVSGGVVSSNLPYGQLFSGRSNSITTKGFFRGIIAADRQSFETMAPNEFVSDRFILLVVRYDLSSLLFSRDARKVPHLEIIGRGMVGTLKSDSGLHTGLSIQAPEKGYFELGLEGNRLFRDWGLGLYYRLGEYSHEKFSRNIAVRLTSKFIF